MPPEQVAPPAQMVAEGDTNEVVPPRKEAWTESSAPGPFGRQAVLRQRPKLKPKPPVPLQPGRLNPDRGDQDAQEWEADEREKIIDRLWQQGLRPASPETIEVDAAEEQDGGQSPAVAPDLNPPQMEAQAAHVDPPKIEAQAPDVDSSESSDSDSSESEMEAQAASVDPAKIEAQTADIDASKMEAQDARKIEAHSAKVDSDKKSESDLSPELCEGQPEPEQPDAASGSATLPSSASPIEQKAQEKSEPREQTSPERAWKTPEPLPVRKSIFSSESSLSAQRCERSKKRRRKSSRSRRRKSSRSSRRKSSRSRRRRKGWALLGVSLAKSMLVICLEGRRSSTPASTSSASEHRRRGTRSKCCQACFCLRESGCAALKEEEATCGNHSA